MPADDPHFPDLAVYALGAMTPEEEAAFERQLAGCPDCQEELPRLRATVGDLEEVPEELFVDGPPENAEFLIRGTLRRIAASEAAADEDARLISPQRPVRPVQFGGPSRRVWLVAAAAAVVLLALGGILGRQTAPAPIAQARPTPTVSAAPTPVAGTRNATSVDPATGVRLTVKVVPAAGWVRVTAAAAGIKAGQRCFLMVVDRSGRKVTAGSWLVSEVGAREGTTLQGSAVVAPADVRAVQVETDAGDVLVSTEV
jgi:anti-sigma factor RsiW